MIKCVIFDLDHTLIKLSIDWDNAMRDVKEVYRKYGVPEDLLKEYKHSVFSMINGIHDKLLKFLRRDDVEEIERVISGVLRTYEIDGVAEAELVPNCEEILSYLKGEGIKIGVVSATSRAAVVKALKRFGLERYVDAIFTRDSPGRIKPSSDHVFACLKALNCAPQDAVLIGDDERDMRAAKGACVLAVGFLVKDYLLAKRRKVPLEYLRLREEKLKKEADVTIKDLLEVRSLLKLYQN